MHYRRSQISRRQDRLLATDHQLNNNNNRITVAQKEHTNYKIFRNMRISLTDLQKLSDKVKQHGRINERRASEA